MSYRHMTTPDTVSHSSGAIYMVAGRCLKDRFLGKAISKPRRQEVSTALV